MHERFGTEEAYFEAKPRFLSGFLKYSAADGMSCVMARERELRVVWSAMGGCVQRHACFRQRDLLNLRTTSVCFVIRQKEAFLLMWTRDGHRRHSPGHVGGFVLSFWLWTNTRRLKCCCLQELMHNVQCLSIYISTCPAPEHQLRCTLHIYEGSTSHVEGHM
jgi:hypothetical protein